MEVKFGDFEEVEKPDLVKEAIKATFAPIKTPKFKKAFVAYPHQCYSEDYGPEHSDDDTLEIYIYSIPGDVASVDPNRGSQLTLTDGKVFSLYNGQRDFLAINTIPKGYQQIRDELDNQIAVTKGNKIWVLYDLYHRLGLESGVQGVAEAVLKFLIEQYLNPPTADTIRKHLISAIDKLVNTDHSGMKEKIASEIKTLEADAHSQEQRLVQLIRQLSDKKSVLEMYSTVKRPSAEEMVKKIEKMPFVKELTFSGGVLTLHTNPINIGPLEYGEWTVKLAQGTPTFTHDMTKKSRHPYEYPEHHFCMGGFATDYADAMTQGQIDRAVRICRAEITNYSITTKQVAVETYMKARMGKDFDKFIEKVKKEKFDSEIDTITISAISGSTVSFIGSIHKADGSIVQTGEKVEIDYAE